MAEVWFYHLEQRPVEQELPGLLQRGLDRGLRMVIFVPDEMSAQALSGTLWGQDDVSFLAHGMDGNENSVNQPILISTNSSAANSARYAFYINGATPADISHFDRASIMFDGRDETRVQQARELWKRFKTAASSIKYWKQADDGRWTDQSA